MAERKPIKDYTTKKPIIPSLKKDLGLFHTTVYGVGLILGAGIYVLAGKAAGLAGNAVWISFLIAAVIAALTGLSYAELSSRFTNDAGEYYYAWKALGKKIAFVVGYLVILAGIISTSTVALGFAGYFASLLGINYLIFIAIGITLLFSIVNFVGIKKAAWLNIIFTTVEVAGLLIIIALGFNFLGSVNYLDYTSLWEVFSASSLIFFAFIGFQSVVKLAEETRNPSKTIPRALILSIIITTILYILIGVSIVSVMGWEQLGASNSPLADVAAIAMGSKAFLLLSIIALFSTGNTVLIGLISVSRMVYGMSKSNCFPSFLSKVHKKRKTPVNAIIAVTMLSLLFILFGDVELIARTTNFMIFLVFIAVNLSVIILRFKNKGESNFRVPFNLFNVPIPAVLGVITSIFMLFNLDIEVIIIGLLLVIAGIVLEIVMDKFLNGRRKIKIYPVKEIKTNVKETKKKIKKIKKVHKKTKGKVKKKVKKKIKKTKKNIKKKK